MRLPWPVAGPTGTARAGPASPLGATSCRVHPAPFLAVHRTTECEVERFRLGPAPRTTGERGGMANLAAGSGGRAGGLAWSGGSGRPARPGQASPVGARYDRGRGVAAIAV